MKKIGLFGFLTASFILSQSFISLPTQVVEEKPDWLIKIERSGIQVIDDGKTCIDITVDVPSFYAYWTNCKE